MHFSTHTFQCTPLFLIAIFAFMSHLSGVEPVTHQCVLGLLGFACGVIDSDFSMHVCANPVLHLRVSGGYVNAADLIAIFTCCATTTVWANRARVVGLPPLSADQRIPLHMAIWAAFQTFRGGSARAQAFCTSLLHQVGPNEPEHP